MKRKYSNKPARLYLGGHSFNDLIPGKRTPVKLSAGKKTFLGFVVNQTWGSMSEEYAEGLFRNLPSDFIKHSGRVVVKFDKYELILKGVTYIRTGIPVPAFEIRETVPGAVRVGGALNPLPAHSSYTITIKRRGTEQKITVVNKSGTPLGSVLLREIIQTGTDNAANPNFRGFDVMDADGKITGIEIRAAPNINIQSWLH